MTLKTFAIHTDFKNPSPSLKEKTGLGLELKINPTFRDQLPPLPEDKYRKLEKDICEKGCFDPIRTWSGYIIDGHNRYKICTENKVEFQTLSLDECFEDETQARIWIIDHQDGRRELEPYQRAELQIKKSTLQKRRRNNQYTKGQPIGNESVAPVGWTTAEGEKPQYPCEQSAKDAGMHRDTYSKACYISQNAPEEVKEKLRKGEATIKGEYQKLKQTEKRAEIFSKVEELAKQDIPACERLYDVISIDPPWDIGGAYAPSATAGYLPLSYPTMSVEEIKELDIPCADDCHVFLWTTQKFLFDAKDVIDAWGLEYACTFTWAKNGGPQPLNLPQYNSEFFIYAKKGKPQFVDTKNFFTVLNAKRTGHSAKPEEFYDMLRRVTAGRRLDMFNRREIEGFDVWGNEVA